MGLMSYIKKRKRNAVLIISFISSFQVSYCQDVYFANSRSQHTKDIYFPSWQSSHTIDVCFSDYKTQHTKDIYISTSGR